jgi:hypothetical protein
VHGSLTFIFSFAQNEALRSELQRERDLRLQECPAAFARAIFDVTCSAGAASVG